MLRALAALRPLKPPIAVSGRAVKAPPGRLVAFPRQPLLAPPERAGQAGSVRRRPFLWSFLAVVVAPTMLAAIYYLAIASGQYVSELRFSLRSPETPRLDALALLEGGGAHQPGTAESHVVVEYLASRAAVDDIRHAIDVEALFASPRADWWARLALPASAEALVEYWRGQVDPFYDPANGTVSVRVRAFTPEDSLHLAQAVVAASEKLVNDLSLRVRRDALRHAEAEVVATEARLKSALGAIRDFREQQGVIDPGKTAEATSGLAAKLRDELARANTELATLRSYMRDDAPSVKVLKARIRSLEAQRRLAVRDLTEPDGAQPAPLTRVLSSYEELESDRRFAETAYQHALAALDQARAESDRQQVYIASFVPPSLPEEALYPRRWRSLGIVALLAFAVWAIGGLAVQSIRDHV